MSGYELSEGIYKAGDFTQEELWKAFRNVFSTKTQNSSSYKFVFLKAIMDCIHRYNKDEYTFYEIFERFTDMYWVLVVKYGLSQNNSSTNETYIEQILKEYPYIEEGTGRRYKKVPCHAPGTRNGATGSAWRGIMPPPGKHWQYTPDKLEEMDANGEIYWSSNGNPRRKVYLDSSSGVPVQDIWLDYIDVNNQNTLITGYPTEKNINMLRRIIEASSNKGDIVLDCFAGSGTTLVAAEELGRQWIGVDIGDESIRTIEHRFQNVSKPMGDYSQKKE